VRSRAESEAMAAALRAEGLKLREIAERMGVAISTVDSWLNDPGGLRLKARKDSYRGTCDTCGGLTDGSAGFNAPTRCLGCLSWTPEAILAALQDWADGNGGLPPREVDCYGTDSLPSPARVKRHFGSWNGGLLAAGFELRCDRRPETWESMLAMIEAGETAAAIAERFGVTPDAIRARLRYRGLTLRAVQEASAVSP
jgi:lambda repressor-like predicted transcriptional regulator